MSMQEEKNRAIAALEGRITSENAVFWQEKLNRLAEDHPGQGMLLDAENLEYISSAGLRVLLSMTKQLKGDLTVQNVSLEVYEIFRMTGFTEMMKVSRRKRQLSVDGCPVIGRGAVGTVYRLDEDTIVKVYEIPDSLPMIENEQRRAKQAFLKGIPTAISYDVVRVGDKYGSVFEMLKASTLNDLIVEQPERTEELVKQYTRFLHSIHAVKMERGELPEAKEDFLGYLKDLRPVLPDALGKRLWTLFSAMPENLHIVHGDIQMKNVMMSGGELQLIDMDTLSVGDPVFDFAGLYVGYKAYNEDEPDNTVWFMGLSKERCDALWERILRYYFEDRPAPPDAENRIRIAAYVRFLYLVAVLGISSPEYRQIRIDHTIQHLEELTAGTGSLELAVGKE